MPRTWSKPFIAILKLHSEEWRKATDKAERRSVVKAVASAITAQVTTGGMRIVSQMAWMM